MARLAKKKTQINKSRDEKGAITIDTSEFQNIKFYLENIYPTNSKI